MWGMNILLDANILLRLGDPTSASHAVAVAAVLALHGNGDSLHINPQSLYEFWVVATRPLSQNGLGLSVAESLAELTHLRTTFDFLDDSPNLFTEWVAVLSTVACQGKVAHDARYIAAMRTHGITHLLTFNGSDFVRFPGITILDPNKVTPSGPTSRSP
jgi:predicted nucleic acid-binding protein